MGASEAIRHVARQPQTDSDRFGYDPSMVICHHPVAEVSLTGVVFQPHTRATVRPANDDRRLLSLHREGSGPSATYEVAPRIVLAADGNDWQPAMIREWIVIHRRLVGRRQLDCRAGASVLRHPWLVACFIRMLSLAPGAVRPLVRFINSPPPMTAAQPERTRHAVESL